MEGFSTFIMVSTMLFICYFVLIRPENKRKRRNEAMRSALKRGNHITTIGGIVARIVDIQEDRLVIETSEDRVRMEIMKWAVSSDQTQEQERKAALAAGKKKNKKKKDTSTEEDTSKKD